MMSTGLASKGTRLNHPRWLLTITVLPVFCLLCIEARADCSDRQAFNYSTEQKVTVNAFKRELPLKLYHSLGVEVKVEDRNCKRVPWKLFRCSYDDLPVQNTSLNLTFYVEGAGGAPVAALPEPDHVIYCDGNETCRETERDIYVGVKFKEDPATGLPDFGSPLPPKGPDVRKYIGVVGVVSGYGKTTTVCRGKVPKGVAGGIRDGGPEPSARPQTGRGKPGLCPSGSKKCDNPDAPSGFECVRRDSPCPIVR
jgi:hypothetical protein